VVVVEALDVDELEQPVKARPATQRVATNT
jgi:hypothetical protein